MELTVERTMSCAENDTELLRRIAAGDDEALRALYAAYGQRLYAYARRLVGEAALAEEVTQDSLVAAWQGARRFRGEGRVIAWLLGIVHHKALNALRGRPALSVPLDEVGDGPPAPEATPDEAAAASEQRGLLRDALDRLTLEHRTVLELIFYQGLSLNEAAAVCGCPLGTVKSRLSYAKAALRRGLDRRGLGVEGEG